MNISRKEMDFVIATVKEAREKAMSMWNLDEIGVHTKDHVIDLVTNADEEINTLLESAIRSRFPEHQVLAEETAGEVTWDSPVWLIDPLDGTTNYAHGFPVVGIIVAFWDGEDVTFGVICDVAHNHCCSATRGGGAWCDGKRVSVSHTASLQASLLATGFPYDRAESEDNNLAEFNYFMPKVQGIRRAGAAALDLIWLAEGRLDGYWEQKLKPWDWAAGSLLVEEAGGTFTDYEGHRWRPWMSNAVGSNGLIHDALLEGIREARSRLTAG